MKSSRLALVLTLAFRASSRGGVGKIAFFRGNELSHVYDQGACDAGLAFAVVEAARVANLRSNCARQEDPLPSVGEAIFCAPLVKNEEEVTLGDCRAQSVAGLLAYLRQGLSSMHEDTGAYFNAYVASWGYGESVETSFCPSAPRLSEASSSITPTHYLRHPVKLMRSWHLQINEFKRALLDYGPVVTRVLDYPVGVNVFMKEFKSHRGVIDRRAMQSFYAKRRGTEIARHVLLVGWGVEHERQVEDARQVGYWHVKTSWGADWGEDGYFRIEIYHDSLGVTDAGTDRSGFAPFAVSVPFCHFGTLPRRIRTALTPFRGLRRSTPRGFALSPTRGSARSPTRSSARSPSSLANIDAFIAPDFQSSRGA